MDFTNQNEERERDLQRLRGLRPIDDDFMRCIFKNNIPLVQHVLRVFTGVDDLRITSVVTQADMKRLVGGRSLCLDALGTDDKGKKYDIEIQRASSGAHVKRARYHSSVMDVENLSANQDFDDLPDTYTIFVTQKDVFHKGKALYPIERMNLATDELFDDGEHILYVNGSYRGSDELGQLMHDFCCSDPDDMINQDLAEISRYYKETEEGVEYMCEIMEEMRNEAAQKASITTYIETCKEFGISDPKDLIQRVLAKFSFLTEAQAKKYVL